MTVSLDELGRKAYEQWNFTFGNLTNDVLPKLTCTAWDSLPAKDKTAWIAAAVAIAKVPYSDLHHLQAYTPIAVKHCARCGKDHDISFMPFRGEPFIEADKIVYSFWGLCPNTGDPVLMTKQRASKG